MTTAYVVRFDAQLDVVHAAGRLRCPRGVLTTTPAHHDGDSRYGSITRVLPCALPMRHDGDCDPAHRLAEEFTVCGLPMHDSPWTVGPADAARCPTCFDLPVTHVEEPML